MLALLLVLPPAALAQQTALEVITLKYKTAEEVIPLLRPFVDPRGAVSGMQNQLILRTTPENLNEIRALLARLDTAPRQLRIVVKQDVDLATRDTLLELSGSVSTGSVRVEVPPGPGGRGGTVTLGQGEDRLRARALATESAQEERSTQHVRVLEGSEAFIRVGQSLPFLERLVEPTPQGYRVTDTVQYRDVTTGFHVRPRLAGERVTLEISPQRMRAGPRGTVSVQQLVTTVSARLGEWVDLGAIGTQGTEERAGLGERRARTLAEERTVLLKVEEVGE